MGLVVGFDRVPADGRCAIGVVCIWEGEAAAVVWAEAPNTARGERTLHTTEIFGGPSATYAGYTITLVGLDPYPVHNMPTDPDSYVGTFVVTPVDATTGNQPSTWSRIKALYAE